MGVVGWPWLGPTRRSNEDKITFKRGVEVYDRRMLTSANHYQGGFLGLRTLALNGRYSKLYSSRS